MAEASASMFSASPVRRVAVTGASGFIGREVVRQLMDAGVDVVILERGDAASTAWRGQCAAIDGLIHLAAPTRGIGAATADEIEEYTRRLFDALPDRPARPLRIAFASSMAVLVAPGDARALDESSPAYGANGSAAMDAYTNMKARQEALVRRLATERGCTLTIVRPSNVWDAAHWLQPSVGPKAGPFWFVVSPARALRVVHVSNCARAFIVALERDAAGIRTVNIDDEADVTAWDFATRTIGRGTRRCIAVPVPGWLFDAGARAAAAALRMFARDRVPGLLIPQRRLARFGTWRIDTTLARRTMRWLPDLRPYRTTA